MKIICDDIRARLRLLGKQSVKAQPRHYYRVVGHDGLLLVVQEGAFDDVLNQQRVLFWEFDTVDGRIICERFPGAPAWWATTSPGELAQASIRKVTVQPVGRARLLSVAIREMLGEGGSHVDN